MYRNPSSPWPDAPYGLQSGPLIYQGDALTVRAYHRPAGDSADITEELPVIGADLEETRADGMIGWSAGTPGASARAEYRRRRAHELARWYRELPWRLALAAGSGLLSSVALGTWRAGFLAAGGTAWLLRFRPSQPTRAWRDGARGERATARRLHRLKRHGYVILHDRRIPGSPANVDHLVIGPSGVFVVDSKRYRGTVYETPDGMAWHGLRALDQVVRTVWWEAAEVADLLERGPQVRVTPVIVVHHARIAWGGVHCGGIAIISPSRLRATLTGDSVLSAEQVARLAERAVRELPAAA